MKYTVNYIGYWQRKEAYPLTHDTEFVGTGAMVGENDYTVYGIGWTTNDAQQEVLCRMYEYYSSCMGDGATGWSVKQLRRINEQVRSKVRYDFEKQYDVWSYDWLMEEAEMTARTCERKDDGEDEWRTGYNPY
jgi:hypothetical protein